MPLIRGDTPRQTPTTSPHRAGLASAAPDERWVAARAMGMAPGDAAALASALQAEDDARVREAILTSLARIGSAESVASVLLLLRSDDADRRTGALDALRAMPEAIGPRLPELLTEPDSDVRLLACELARSLDQAEAQRLLCELIEQDPEVNVCAAAVEVLAELGDAEALAALDRCAERFPNERFLRFSIEVTAGRIASRPMVARD